MGAPRLLLRNYDLAAAQTLKTLGPDHLKMIPSFPRRREPNLPVNDLD
jgi:hypothetical protein